jgi:hypothetical protein
VCTFLIFPICAISSILFILDMITVMLSGEECGCHQVLFQRQSSKKHCLQI